MKIIPGTVLDLLSRWRTYFQGNNTFSYGHEEPLRSELYSLDQLISHGAALARAHKLQAGHSRNNLLKRLDDNEHVLLEVRNLLAESFGTEKTITPAAEWLLDNFYLIEEQILIARKHLPKGYSEGLPCLAEGVSAGLPRVYDIVLEIISHSDSRVDEKSLNSFIAAYQTSSILTLGELWAIPIMLRLAVIESLRRVAGRIALDRVDDTLAGYWAAKMTTVAREDPANLILCIADMARSRPVLQSPFVAAFTRKLQGKGPALALSLSWMEQQLSAVGSSSTALIREENKKQAADQVSVRNSIDTLRVIGATDWRDFVEDLSSVEQVLRQDPAGAYPRMDFGTRDQYRHAVESMAKSCGLPEMEVAGKALELTAQRQEHTGQGQEEEKTGRYRHIGYYLIDKGRAATERAIGVHYLLRWRPARLSGRLSITIYLLSIFLLTLAAATGMCYITYRYGGQSGALLWWAGLLSLAGSAQLVIALVNWLSTLLVKPVLLPRMDFSLGIPATSRTLIVVPTLLTGEAEIDALLEGLELRFLANREVNLHFGLLTDFPDASEEVQPQDGDWLERARSGIQALNQRYMPGEQDLFFLFHRPRTWNGYEKKWMGYERKRGKLAALNAFLQGRGGDAFSLIAGNYPVLSGVKYVITLDTDTLLPREAARRMIETMAHPLNKAWYDPQKGRVTQGYGILQPRVAQAMPEMETTLYLRLQTDPTGIDPYTRASSDVYQDLFGEGSFIGKGIYDVDMFERAVLPVLQENRILSHDLLEGCYARSGLLSDVNLYEESPALYQADVKRRHRWIRGDWQAGAWMLPFVTNGKGHLTKNRLSALSRWKIFDNLRRSLLPLSLLLLLLSGWFLFPFPWFWTVAVSAFLLLPGLVSAVWQLLHKPLHLAFLSHLEETGVAIRDALVRFAFELMVLPYEALIYTDAILRTNWRMIISRKKLLEWASSAAVSRNTRNEVQSVYRSMWISPLLSLAIAGALIYTHSQVLYFAAPFLVGWLLAPVIIWWVGLPIKERTVTLPAAQERFLHHAARRTWFYFEQLVTAEDNWLPPDNYQEQPVAVVAHRTSPTNMGLSLLSALAAWDFGYISGGELLNSCSRTLGSMSQLQRYEGHFYNWYDTRSMQPLQPRYVSAVDSGNLSGHLLTLRQGLLALPQQPVINRNLFEGLYTTAGILSDLTDDSPVEAEGKLRPMLAALTAFKQLAGGTSSISLAIMQLDKMALEVEKLLSWTASGGIEVVKWAKKLLMQIKQSRDDVAQLCPWFGLLPVPSRFSHLMAVDHPASLQELHDLSDNLLPVIDAYEWQANSPEEQAWLASMRVLLTAGGRIAGERILLSQQLAAQCELLSDAAWDFLLAPATGLLSIGYNVDEQRKDNSYYDLLASEMRLGIFTAIAQGKLTQESWFSPGRLLVRAGGDPILLSWSGSMFEYLMPQLVMPDYENTLLSQTMRAAVKRQIEYAGQQRVPWGISESAYNMVDASLNYQYRAFGVPGLGLKRGLKDDLVISNIFTDEVLLVRLTFLISVSSSGEMTISVLVYMP